MEPVTHRFHQAPGLARRLVSHPRWFAESVRLARARRTHAREQRLRPFDVSSYGPIVVSLREALAEFAPQYDPNENSGATPSVGMFGATEDIALLLRAVVTGMKPRTVLEIGVAHGVSSSVILRALEANREGRLWSIDLPPLTIANREVGRLVPDDLRRRWALTLGPSNLLLPKLAPDLAPIDLFLHDGDHTHDQQLADLRAVWPHMREAGLVIVDNVGNPAFLEFCDHVGKQPILIRRASPTDAIGVVAA
jgi:predicted O-methyltransferase YrrM